MSAETFTIRGEYIELQQLLKAVGVIDLGSEIRAFLSENEVWVNGELENRRGKKLRPGDLVVLADGRSWSMA